MKPQWLIFLIRARRFCICSILLLLPNLSFAATRTWSGGASGLWATGANWSGGTAPAAGDDVVFPAGAARFVVTNNFSPNRAFNSITFLAGYTVHGNPLILTNGLRCGHTTTVDIRAGVTIAGPQSFIVTNGSASLFLLNTNLDLGVFGLTIGGNGKTEISSAISGASGIVKNGTNILHFYGSTANTYAGATVVNAGTLQLNKNGVTAIAGQLFIGDGVGGQDADIVHVLSNEQIADNAAIQINNSGLLYCAGNVLESIGSLTLVGGRTFAPGPSGALILLNNVTTLASTNTARFDGRVSFAASRTLTVADGLAHPDLTITATLIDGAGNVNLIKNGTGTLRISGANGLTGNTIIREGWLESAGETSLRHTIVSNNAVLRFIGLIPPAFVSGFNLTLNGSGDGNGALQLTNGHSGWRGPIVFASQSTIGIFGNTNSFTIGATNGRLSGPWGFTKIGDGSLRITNNLASTYEGNVFVHGGMLELGNVAGSNAILGLLVIGDGVGGAQADVVRLLTRGQIHDLAPVTVNSSGLLDCSLTDGNSESIGPLTLNNGGRVWSPIIGAFGVRDSITCNGDATSRIQGSGSLVVGGANPIINVTGSGSTLNLEITPVIENVSLTKTGPGRLRIGESEIFSALNINQGTLEAAPGTRLAQNGAVITVQSNATLQLAGGTIIGRSLVLNGHGVNGTEGALRATGTGSNIIWAGSVTLASDSLLRVNPGAVFSPETTLTLTEPVTGPGKLILDGGGTLRLTGNMANTYSGGTWIRDGYFDLMKTNGVTAIPGNVVIGDGLSNKNPDLHLNAANQIANGFDVTMTNGMFDLNTFAETIGTLNGIGAVVLGPGSTLNVSPSSGVSCTFAGGLSSPGKLTKSGNGSFRLTGTNTFTGNTTLSAGTLHVDGQITSSPLTLTGGRLQGFGRVANLIPNAPGCLIAPGTSPGILTCSNFNAAGTGSGFLQFEMNGLTPGSGYDQLDVRGTVNLTGLNLMPILTFPSALSNQFILIKNDGADAVVGTFNGWPQNSLIPINGEQFRISYTGGDGNDVVLTQVSANTRPSLSIQRISPAMVRLLWPTNTGGGFTLQTNATLGTINWSNTLPAPAVLGTNYVVTNSILVTNRFYRLFKP